MRERILGDDLLVSAIGLGCMGMSHAYGAPADKKEMTGLLVVGEALKPYRNKVVLATKFGIHFDLADTHTNKAMVPDSRPEVIRASVEASLTRLNTDHIDLYYQHRPDPAVPVEEVAGVMTELIEEGKITHWGLLEATEEVIRRAHAVCPVTAIQNRYSMMARQHEAGTDYRSMMPQFTAEGIEQNRGLLGLLERMSEEKQATPAAISLAWMMGKKPCIVPIPGTRKESRLRENAGAAQIDLTPEELASIDGALNHMEMSEVFGGTQIKKNR